MQRLSGDAAVALRPSDLRFASATQHKTLSNIHNQLSQSRETKVAPDTAKITTRRKSSEWSAFWKNLLRHYCPVRRLPDNFFLLLRSLPSSFSGAGEGIRTPDPLITNQMLYRLSYASNWGKARSRANLSHGSLPDVRDNYIKYHSANNGRNMRTRPDNQFTLLLMLSFPDRISCDSDALSQFF